MIPYNNNPSEKCVMAIHLIRHNDNQRIMNIGKKQNMISEKNNVGYGF